MFCDILLVWFVDVGHIVISVKALNQLLVSVSHNTFNHTTVGTAPVSVLHVQIPTVKLSMIFKIKLAPFKWSQSGTKMTLGVE